MDRRPFFTVGVPVYNSERYLEMCINSILTQSFSDFELILVNDGSTDNSLEICKNSNNERVNVISVQNGGVSAASNVILDKASGMYIFLMDNDDEMEEDMLKSVYDILNKHSVDILIGSYYAISPNGEKRLRRFNNPEIKNGFINHQHFLQYKLNTVFPTSMWSKVVRTDYWKQTGVRFCTEFDGVQDADVSFRLMEQAKKVLYTDIVFVNWYHPREGSLSTSWSFNMMRNYWKLSVKLLVDELSNEETDFDMKNDIIEHSIRKNGHTLWRITDYSNSELLEFDDVIAPVREYLNCNYADDSRTKFLFWCIKRFGAAKGAVIINRIQKLKKIRIKG